MSYLDPATRRAAVYGYRVVLRDSFPDDDHEIPGNPLGWTDHNGGDGLPAKRCYVFRDRIDHIPLPARTKIALKIALHEVGHARWRNVRRTPNWWRYIRGGSLGTDQQVEEDYCEVYAYSIYTRESVWNEPAYLSGVSYSFRSPVPSHNRIMTYLTRLL